MATCFGNGQLCTEGCQGEAKFSVRDLMEGAYRNGMPLHKLFVRELPELSHLMLRMFLMTFIKVTTSSLRR